MDGDEPRVVRADNAGLFTLDGTRSWILGREEVVVIDPGPDDPSHLDRLADEVRGARAGTILVTHAHPDHSGGVRGLEERTGFGVGASGPLGGGGLVEAARADGRPVLAVPTPGHTRDHLAFLVGGDLFVGDLLLGEGSTTWVGSYPGCLADYLASLDRVERLSPRRILPAHGPPIGNPSEALERFRRHRFQRLHQLEEVLAEGWYAEVLQGAGVEELANRIVERIYGDALPPKARAGARWSVLAGLEYLGRIAFPPNGPADEGEAPLAPDS